MTDADDRSERIPKNWDMDTERLLLGRALSGIPIDRRLRSWHFADRGHQLLFCCLLLSDGWTGVTSLQTVAEHLRAARLWLGMAHVELLGELMEGAAWTLEPDVGAFVRAANRRLAAEKLTWIAAAVRRGEIGHAQLRAELEVML